MTVLLKEAFEGIGISSPGVSSAGRGRIYFDSGTNKWKFSESGGAYTDFGTGTGSSGANTALSNLSAVTINTALLPAFDNLDGYNLGSPTKTWHDGYVFRMFHGTGTASAPSISFTGDQNTGLYNLGADQIGFVTGGSSQMSIDSSGGLSITPSAAVTGITLRTNNSSGGANDRWVSIGTVSSEFVGIYNSGATGGARLQLTASMPILAGQGTVSLPGHSFVGDADTGIWSSGANTVNFSTNAIERAVITTDGYVGINTIIPNTYLDVATNVDGYGIAAIVRNTNAANTSNANVGIDYRLSTNAGAQVVAARVAAGKEQTWTSTASTQDGYLAFSTALDGVLSEAGRFNSASTLQLNKTSGNAITVPSGAGINFTGGGAVTLSAESGARLNSSAIVRSDSGYWIGGVVSSWTTAGLAFSASSATAWLRQDQTSVVDARVFGNSSASGQVATQFGTQKTDAAGATNSILLQVVTDAAAATPVAKLKIDGYGDVNTDGYYGFTGISQFTPKNGMFQPAATTVGFAVNASEKARFTTDGYLGIGTTVPNEKLTVSGPISLAETTATSATANFGKLYVKSSDSNLYFLSDGGVETQLSPAAASMAIGGSITSATAGSVLFAGVAGILQQDNTNFFWDDTNDRLGIGTNVPAHKFEIIAGSLADTIRTLNITGTFPSSTTGAQIGALMTFTSAGSTSNDQRGLQVTLAGGYTGASNTYGGLFSNNASTSDTNHPITNPTIFGTAAGVTGFVHGTGAGNRVGAYGYADTGTTNNIGSLGYGWVKSGMSGLAYGAIGVASSAGDTGLGIGGYFALATGAGTITGSGSFGLVADNGATTGAIFEARDNATAVFTIADGGATTAQSASMVFTVRTSGDVHLQTSVSGFTYLNSVVTHTLLGRYHRSDINSATTAVPATYNDGIYIGYGRNSSGNTGIDTFTPSTAVNTVHLDVVDKFAPSASSPGFAAVQITPEISGTSSGKATALVVASRTNTLTGGTVKLLDVGTTTTDYFTGYTSVLSATPDGYVGINNVSPTRALDVVGDGYFNGVVTHTKAVAYEIGRIGTTTLSNLYTTVLGDATAGTVTYTLPAASGCQGRLYNIKKIDSSANTIVIDGNASETIDGALTQTLTTQYESLTIQSDGSNWFII